MHPHSTVPKRQDRQVRKGALLKELALSSWHHEPLATITALVMMCHGYY